MVNKENSWNEHEFLVFLNNCKLYELECDKAILIYDIEEAGMCQEYGRIAILDREKAQLKVISAPRMLQCFLGGPVSGIQVVDTKSFGEVVVINYLFLKKTQTSESENPFVFLRCTDMMVSVIRLNHGCAFQIGNVTGDLVEFVKKVVLRKDLDGTLQNSFDVDVGQLRWWAIDVFDNDLESFSNLYFSLPLPLDIIKPTLMEQ